MVTVTVHLSRLCEPLASQLRQATDPHAVASLRAQFVAAGWEPGSSDPYLHQHVLHLDDVHHRGTGFDLQQSTNSNHLRA